MKILAIRLGRFGDLVLLLPALALLKWRVPGCRLTLLTDSRWAPLANMSPAIDEVVPVDRIAMRDGSTVTAVGAMFRLVSEIRHRRFDAVIDFHGFRETNLLTWLSGAPQRWGLKRFDQAYLGFCFNKPPVVEDKSLHASRSFHRLVDAFAPKARDSEPSPAVLPPNDEIQWVQQSFKNPFVVLFVDAPVPGRIWPIERFVALARLIQERYGVEALLVSDSEKQLPAEPGDIRTLSRLSIPRLAAVISQAQMLVSNDTGPMHLGPVLGIPTIGIFSVGIPAHFRPTGSWDAYLQGNPITKVETADVIETVDRVWAATGRRGLRC